MRPVSKFYQLAFEVLLYRWFGYRKGTNPEKPVPLIPKGSLMERIEEKSKEMASSPKMVVKTDRRMITSG